MSTESLPATPYVCVTGYGTLDPIRIKQVGSNEQCGKAGCTVRSPWWRVGLGRFKIQAYACTAHLGWAVALDMLGESRARAMGWEPIVNGTIESVWVTPNLAAIARTEFGRTPDVSAQFPVARPTGDGTYHHEWR